MMLKSEYAPGAYFRISETFNMVFIFIKCIYNKPDILYAEYIRERYIRCAYALLGRISYFIRACMLENC